MNNFHPESLLVVAKQKIQEDVANSLAWKHLQGFSVRRGLVILGAWMVENGEKLQTRNSTQRRQISWVFHKTKPDKSEAKIVSFFALNVTSKFIRVARKIL